MQEEATGAGGEVSGGVDAVVAEQKDSHPLSLLQRSRIAAWVHDLRLGVRKQGKGYLARDDEFCCLGVACEVAAYKGLAMERRVMNGIVYYTSPEGDVGAKVLPAFVREWYGLPFDNPYVTFWDPSTGTRMRKQLSELNDDNSFPFPLIASIVEQNFLLNEKLWSVMGRRNLAPVPVENL